MSSYSCQILIPFGTMNRNELMKVKEYIKEDIQMWLAKQLGVK